MFFVYILENIQGNHYIGSTEDTQKRLIRHNNSGSVWTKSRGSWKIIYQEMFKTRSEAQMKERLLKSFKGGNGLKKFIILNAPC